MAIKIEKIYKEWGIDEVFGEGQFCPVCHGTEFTHLEPAGGIYCNKCDATFSCRYTNGDPGLVVDCYPNGYTKNGKLEKNGVKYYIDPARFYSDQVSFWQVLKPCNGGLDDRKYWCTGSKAQLHHSLKEAPYGEELFFFNPRVLARKQGAPIHDFFAFTTIEKEHPEGYYRREQCEEVYEDDHMWVHRCLPKAGEKPVFQS